MIAAVKVVAVERQESKILWEELGKSAWRRYNLRWAGTETLKQEKAVAPHSSTLAWKTPWTEEPGGLQAMGLLRVGHD